MNLKIITPYMGSQAKGEINEFPSLTIPDQSMSVREIIRRHSSGLSLNGLRVPEYDGETDPTGLNGRDFRTLDLSEKHDLIRENRQHIKNLQTQAIENAKAIDEAKKATIVATIPNPVRGRC